MANAYANLAQFDLYADVRTTGMLSNDSKGRSPNDAVRQQALDMQASELESYLDGRYALPLATVPMVLTKWVLATAYKVLYGRRGQAPPQIKADVEWAEAWTEKLVEGKVNVPGLSRQTDAALDSSDYVDGRSRFDHLFGIGPTSTSTSRGR
jgi:phage gp36-like protein